MLALHKLRTGSFCSAINLAPLAFVLFALLGCSNQAPNSDQASYLANVDRNAISHRGKLNFVNDVALGLQLAAKHQKPCLLFFTAEWCTFCHQMEETAFVDTVVENLSNRFICVLVDADRYRPFCQQYKISGFPTLQFVSPEGRPLNRLVGRQSAMNVAQGMQSALERIAWIDDANSQLR